MPSDTPADAPKDGTREDGANEEGVEVLDADGLPIGDEEDGTEPEIGHDPESDPRKNPIPSNLPVLAPPTSTALRKGDLLSYYLAEVRRYPLLEPEEEKELAIRYQETGDPEAAQRLVTANLRLVVKLAFQYHRQWSNVLDLIQEGNVGLVEALSRYDPYRGIRFSSYAQYWIRAMILRFLMDNYRMVRLGSTRHGRKLFFQLQKERDRLIEQGIQPSTKALAEALNVPEQEVINVDQHLSAPALSIHGPTGGEDGRPLSEVIPDQFSASPEDQAASGELGTVVRDHLANFAQTTLRDDRERAIWERRLTAADPESLSALGEAFGVSKERIRQVEARIKRRLRAYLTEEMGEEIAFEFEVPED
ncbi:MAG: sigma-70 family RNA polymerase sigma factor [Myxococcota bacterium]